MKPLAETMDVSLSNLREQALQPRPVRALRYKLEDDQWLLPMIERLCGKKATYGYRRVTKILNDELVLEGKPRVNPKRIYRIMKQNGLLLQKAISRKDRPHNGQIITLRSNTRWCSDGFEISCWNGEKVQVAFALDTCDREAISWVATDKAISGLMIRDLLTDAVEKRFGRVSALPHPIEWLSDNGGCYRAGDTKAFARELGFKVCFTPVESPQSNGMAEAFVKTMKRDYVYMAERPDAETVLRQLPGWFEDYNNFAPHKGLKMMSPREYQRSLQN